MWREVALGCALAFAVVEPATANAAATPSGERVYTLVPGDEDPATLVAHMGVSVADPFREILFWNPQLHDVYDLTPGTRLRVPGTGARPAFPAFSRDFSQWRLIASHTTRFVGSPRERVANIINAANSVNSFFNDERHPYVQPRDSLSLMWLLGDITIARGFVWGPATGTYDGELSGGPVIGDGICHLSSTIFPAVMKAGLDVTARSSHAYYPYYWSGYPEGYGWDATVQPPLTDLVWRNLYDYPVRLFMRADLTRWTLTAEVWAPPQLVPYATVIDGPYVVTPGELIPTSDLGWVWYDATTVIRQTTALDGRNVTRSFWSHYGHDPNWSSRLY